MSRPGRVLAVIPARGGSKGIPRKNIRPLGGIPLLHYTIRAAQAATGIDLLVVSTEDAEIAESARALNVRVIDRPAELASDTARTGSALIHALDEVEREGEPIETLVLLEATSPFREAETISRCIAKLHATGAASLVTVRETRDYLGELIDGQWFRPLDPKAPRRRQERRPLYIECGVVYVCRTAHLRATGSLVAEPWAAEVVAGREAIDLNTMADWHYAEFLLAQTPA